MEKKLKIHKNLIQIVSTFLDFKERLNLMKIKVFRPALGIDKLSFIAFLEFWLKNDGKMNICDKILEISHSKKIPVDDVVKGVSQKIRFDLQKLKKYTFPIISNSNLEIINSLCQEIQNTLSSNYTVEIYFTTEFFNQTETEEKFKQVLQNIHPLINALKISRSVEKWYPLILLENFPKSIKYLDLSWTKHVIYKDIMGFFWSEIFAIPSLTSLNVSVSCIAPDYLSTIAQKMEGKTNNLQLLNMSFQTFDSAYPENLILFTKNYLCVNDSLEILKIAMSNLGNSGLKILAEMFRKNKRLKALDLAQSGIFNEGIAYLSSAVLSNPGCALEELNLTWNNLSNCEEIAKFVRNYKKLKALDLKGCRLGEAGVAMVIDSVMENKTIESLNLSGNDPQKASDKLFDLIEQNTNLKSFSYAENRLSSIQVERLVEKLAVNKTLNYLDLNLNQINFENMKLLIQMAVQKKHDFSLNFSNNSFSFLQLQIHCTEYGVYEKSNIVIY